MKAYHRKSTRKTAPPGVKTQTQCSGREACNTGRCEHVLPWWHTHSTISGKKGK